MTSSLFMSRDTSSKHSPIDNTSRLKSRGFYHRAFSAAGEVVRGEQIHVIAAGTPFILPFLFPFVSDKKNRCRAVFFLLTHLSLFTFFFFSLCSRRRFSKCAIGLTSGTRGVLRETRGPREAFSSSFMLFVFSFRKGRTCSRERERERAVSGFLSRSNGSTTNQSERHILFFVAIFNRFR